MKKSLMTGALVLGCWAGSAQAAATITFTPGGATVDPRTTVFEDFESYDVGSPLPGGSGAIAASGTADGVAAQPAFGSSGNYGAVFGSGSYTVSFGPTSVFSFVLGSLDSYNTLVLRYQSGPDQTLNGGAIIGLTGPFTNGDQTSPTTNGVVTYNVTTGPLLVGATFSSGQNAFEIDNLAAAVPEPAAWGMMILGFGLVGGALRRRPATKVKFAF